LFGYWRKYLDIDLTTGSISDYEIPESWLTKHLGGRGIAARILLRELSGREDALSPGNIIVFGTGPLQGLNIPGAGRHLVMAISPKTRTVNGSYAGGFFAHELGTSGYDGIIVRGKASTPKYISLIAGEASIHPADELWGKDTGETEDTLKAWHKGARVSSIGPAGERLVQCSCIINDYNRAAGRPGWGAVMGSKNLKAVVVKGGLEKQVADREAFLKSRSNFARNLADNQGLQAAGEYGTGLGMLIFNEWHLLPTANFTRGTFEGVEKISGEEMCKSILVGRDTCTACPVRCKRVVRTTFEGEEVLEKFGGPEYETLAAFGSNCLNDNLDAIALANQKCNRYGIDTISAGNIIAFLMECVEKGKVDLDLKWGSAKGIIEIIDKIAFRQGVGDLIAEGIDYLAKELGAEDCAVAIKGQEVPMHDPRGKMAFAIDYATTPRGGQHMEGVHDYFLESEPLTPELGVVEPMDRFSWKDKARIAKIYGDLRSFTNSLIMCAFTNASIGPNYNYPLIRALVRGVTGLRVDPDEMLRIGERNYILLKLHAARYGYTRKDDYLPPRLLESSPDLPEGANAVTEKGLSEQRLQEKIDEFYELRGFDRYGPTDQKLEDIGLHELKGTIQRL